MGFLGLDKDESLALTSLLTLSISWIPLKIGFSKNYSTLSHPSLIVYNLMKMPKLRGLWINTGRTEL